MAQTLPGHQALVDFLDNDEVWRGGRVDCDGQPLTPQQRQKLLTLVQHFGISAPQQCDCSKPGNIEPDEDGNDVGVPKSRKRGAVRHPWKPFMMIELPRLPERHRAYLDTFGTDPSKFMNDDKAIRHEVADFDESSLGDAFLACYTYTEKLETRLASDRMRWFFSMLMYFDLVQLIRPDSSGRRVGRLMLQELVQFAGPVLEAGGLVADVALKQINRWSLYGSKLDTICRTFGAGSLFYLEEQLSSDFLRNKFTASGPNYDDAVEHLCGIGLKQAACASKATELGERVRHMLIKPFRVASVLNVSDNDDEAMSHKSRFTTFIYFLGLRAATILEQEVLAFGDNALVAFPDV
ncbi:MAG: hypothetical protein Q9188_004818 [Gyalolechia gomerana]